MKDPIAHALASTLNYEKSHFDKLVASLLPLMEKLTTGRTAAQLSPALDDPTDWRPLFDWTGCWQDCVSLGSAFLERAAIGLSKRDSILQGIRFAGRVTC